MELDSIEDTVILETLDFGKRFDLYQLRKTFMRQIEVAPGHFKDLLFELSEYSASEINFVLRGGLLLSITETGIDLNDYPAIEKATKIKQPASPNSDFPAFNYRKRTNTARQIRNNDREDLSVSRRPRTVLEEDPDDEQFAGTFVPRTFGK